MTNTKTTVRELIEKLKEFDGDTEVLFYAKRIRYNVIENKINEMIWTQNSTNYVVIE
jgi:hypothetical protein